MPNFLISFHRCKEFNQAQEDKIIKHKYNNLDTTSTTIILAIPLISIIFEKAQTNLNNKSIQAYYISTYVEKFKHFLKNTDNELYNKMIHGLLDISSLDKNKYSKVFR